MGAELAYLHSSPVHIVTDMTWYRYQDKCDKVHTWFILTFKKPRGIFAIFSSEGPVLGVGVKLLLQHCLLCLLFFGLLCGHCLIFSSFITFLCLSHCLCHDVHCSSVAGSGLLICDIVLWSHTLLLQETAGTLIQSYFGWVFFIIVWHGGSPKSKRIFLEIKLKLTFNIINSFLLI